MTVDYLQNGDLFRKPQIHFLEELDILLILHMIECECRTFLPNAYLVCGETRHLHLTQRHMNNQSISFLEELDILLIFHMIECECCVFPTNTQFWLAQKRDILIKRSCKNVLILSVPRPSMLSITDWCDVRMRFDILSTCHQKEAAPNISIIHNFAM